MIDILEKLLTITSTQNSKVKELLKLWDRRDRDKSALFLIEGYREFTRALTGACEIGQLYICPELFLGSNEISLIQECIKREIEVIRCSEKVFRHFSYRDRPDGIMAVATQKRNTLQDLEKKLPPNPLLCVVEAIEKPGNLGTILRSSDAVKVDGVIVCDRCTDLYNPNVVRASVGTLFTVPHAEATSEELIAWLKKNNVSIVSTTPSAEKEYTDVPLNGAVAIAMGSEQYGLSAKWLDSADVKVRIPMLGVADSLNVAMATTLLLYEALRQRRAQ